jgi:hypothetical protein
MKTMKKSLGTVAIASAMILTVSCKDGNKNDTGVPTNDEKHQETMGAGDDMTMSATQGVKAEAVLKDYFNLKDALVGDNNALAKDLGMTLTESLKSLDISSYSDSEQNDLKNIIEDATLQGEHIGESDIKHQRERFKTLSKDITAMVAITGTERKIYEQFCPMYDGGTAWLSTKEEVKNPYYGSQMLTCGKVQREIN